MNMLDLQHPTSNVIVTVRATAHAGQHDRKMLSALFRAMDHAAKSNKDGKLRALDRLINLSHSKTTRNRQRFIEKMRLRNMREGK